MHKRGFYEKYIKRFQDFICALTAIIILSPVLFIIAVLVYFKFGTPILFKQKRPGINGEIFEIYKFRTMTNEVDDKGILLPDDVRLTAFGKKLRSTSLDELPELWNILKGDLSVVGPRPLLVEYLTIYNKKQARRHEVRPGITGLAQINGRNAISWTEKFSWDIKYIDNISFIGDWKIILKTIFVVLNKAGINSKGSATMEKFTGEEK